MNKILCAAAAAGLVLTIVISNFAGIVSDGKKLDNLRNSVLRLHILADSDSRSDQQLKLMVRDTLLEHSGEIFGSADSLEAAEASAEANLGLIEELAEETLLANGCTDNVTAELATMYFDERVYGDITMPAGDYRALRVTIGSAQGKNWWCVMYPPLCIPAACSDEVSDNKEAEEELFDDEQRDILYHPAKYEIRFALWDKFRSLLKKIS